MSSILHRPMICTEYYSTLRTRPKCSAVQYLVPGTFVAFNMSSGYDRAYRLVGGRRSAGRCKNKNETDSNRFSTNMPPNILNSPYCTAAAASKQRQQQIKAQTLSTKSITDKDALPILHEGFYSGPACRLALRHARFCPTNAHSNSTDNAGLVNKPEYA